MIRRARSTLEVAAGLTVLTAMILAVALPLLGRQAAESGDALDSSKSPPTASESTPGKASSGDIHFVGLASGSCATANCHGGVATEGKAWKTSAFEFLSNDPHARAFDVLFAERSRDIVQRLTGTETKDASAYLSLIEDRCVTCHGSPLPEAAGANAKLAGVDIALQHYSFGVSCEACHGPASRWMNQHLSDEWKTNVAKADPHLSKQKRDAGFNELYDVSIAAQTCSKCHIGGKAERSDDSNLLREVTHDLIAAGHPRLDFDFAAWYRAMPKHWDTKREATFGFNTEAWQRGQAAALNARVQLASLQRQRVESDIAAAKPWPELAHFDCYACHHALRFPSTFSPVYSEPLPFGSGWQPFAELFPKDVAITHSQLSSVLLKKEVVSANTEFSLPMFLKPSELAQQLAEIPSDSSWDALAAWYYAADAVLHDAKSGMNDSAGYLQARKSLDDLARSLEDALRSSEGAKVSRYHSPGLFVRPGLELEPSPPSKDQEPPSDFFAHQQRLAEKQQGLAKRWQEAKAQLQALAQPLRLLEDRAGTP